MGREGRRGVPGLEVLAGSEEELLLLGVGLDVHILARGTELRSPGQELLLELFFVLEGAREGLLEVLLVDVDAVAFQLSQELAERAPEALVVVPHRGDVGLPLHAREPRESQRADEGRGRSGIGLAVEGLAEVPGGVGIEGGVVDPGENLLGVSLKFLWMSENGARGRSRRASRGGKRASLAGWPSFLMRWTPKRFIMPWRDEGKRTRETYPLVNAALQQVLGELLE